MKRSIITIIIASLIQPYIVLFPFTGPSSKCIDCTIIEQTFLTSFLYLILPLCALYSLTYLIRLNAVLMSILIVAYYAPVSFVKLTIPVFKDRIAAWSTYNENEIWNEALIQARPTLLLLSISLFFAMFYSNKKPLIKS